MTIKLETFIRRLRNIDIHVTLVGNFPWIYLDSVNGKKVKGTFYANHGWTIFFYTKDIKFSDRREVFKKIRSML